MITRAQETFIRSLHTKKGRLESGYTLIEGQKHIETAGTAVEWTFTEADTPRFSDLMTTDTPQEIAGVARIPEWSLNDIQEKDRIVVLDGVQDPGNVGAILRLCLGFNASVILVESADITAPKVVRASSGALFSVPWVKWQRNTADQQLQHIATELEQKRNIYRLEKRDNSTTLQSDSLQTPCILIAGSEGNGIQLSVPGTSIMIAHQDTLESLNVTHALAIALWTANQN